MSQRLTASMSDAKRSIYSSTPVSQLQLSEVDTILESTFNPCGMSAPDSASPWRIQTCPVDPDERQKDIIDLASLCLPVSTSDSVPSSVRMDTSVSPLAATGSSSVVLSPAKDFCPGYFDGIADDIEWYTNGNSSSPGTSLTTTSPEGGGADVEDATSPKIARPPNAWILYRSDMLAEFKKTNPHIYEKKTKSKADRGTRPTQANMSKCIADRWAAEPASVKERYHQEAVRRSQIHAVEFPSQFDYTMSALQACAVLLACLP